MALSAAEAAVALPGRLAAAAGGVPCLPYPRPGSGSGSGPGGGGGGLVKLFAPESNATQMRLGGGGSDGLPSSCRQRLPNRRTRKGSAGSASSTSSSSSSPSAFPASLRLSSALTLPLSWRAALQPDRRCCRAWPKSVDWRLTCRSSQSRASSLVPSHICRRPSRAQVSSPAVCRNSLGGSGDGGCCESCSSNISSSSVTSGMDRRRWRLARPSVGGNGCGSGCVGTERIRFSTRTVSARAAGPSGGVGGVVVSSEEQQQQQQQQQKHNSLRHARVGQGEEDGDKSNECEARAWDVVRELDALDIALPPPSTDISSSSSSSSSPSSASRLPILRKVLEWSGAHPSLPAAERTRETRLMACTARVWAAVGLVDQAADPTAAAGLSAAAPSTAVAESAPGLLRVEVRADSDAATVRGLCALLCRIVSGCSVADVLALDVAKSPALAALTAHLGPAFAGVAGGAGGRAAGILSMLLSVQKKARLQLAQAVADAQAEAATVVAGEQLDGPGPGAALAAALAAQRWAAAQQRVLEREGGGLSAVQQLPSILITCEDEDSSSDARGTISISAQGEFAKAQAQYLQPDSAAVAALVRVLREKKVGVVAHFYMDPEVQGVLAAAAAAPGEAGWPHIAISDSLVMADRALAMVRDGGCEAVAVLGVDFMAENVRAVLDKGGCAHVPVLRMAPGPIGCSLAEAARSPEYEAWLGGEAAATPRSLHVIYINTALDTKAAAHALVPTITCTSSNVLQTVLQAFAQVPDLTLWYGPDTYMGGNLVEMLRQLSALPDDDIRQLHPNHTAHTLKHDVLPRLRYFQDGTCIVHDMFGADVVAQLRGAYADAFLTAHFEVPGEMFALAMEARSRGRGVVGSTQNILDFIVARVREFVALQRSAWQGGDGDGGGVGGSSQTKGGKEPTAAGLVRLQFVLGTEAGMVTAIVNAVRRELLLAQQQQQREQEGGGGGGGGGVGVEVEIVFPVSSSAIAPASSPEGEGLREGADSSASAASASLLGDSGLKVVPGVASGEGCSMAGGCASCPYMKMNSLDALMHVCQLIGRPESVAMLAAHEPDKFAQPMVMPAAAASGRPLSLSGSISGGDSGSHQASVADLGYEPILHMRHFQKSGRLSDELVNDILTRHERR